MSERGATTQCGVSDLQERFGMYQGRHHSMPARRRRMLPMPVLSLLRFTGAPRTYLQDND